MPLTNHKMHELLASLHFTGPLPAQSLVHLANLGVVRDYNVGETVFREGSPSEHVFVIVTGHIALEMQLPGRGPVRILTLGPGDLLAWSGLVGGRRMTATATVLESTQLVAFPARRIAELADSDHEFGYAWMRATADALAKRLVATRLQLLDLFAEPTDALPPFRGSP